MAGTADSPGPSYVSSHSADGILSDVRQIKLKTEALHSINVFLDEILYSILGAANSLSTDKLRASLLGLLPTTLGKEALLEAEVELRAYWDRTTRTDVRLEDDSSTFHLQWAFEILRLKCEAYSTLNDTDEDHEAEARINHKMTMAGGTQLKAALIAPASLYLTAILEAICEHILSSIGRVVARDSSRTNATVQDLFVALCEDHSIYGLFKTMKVYEQIEQLSKGPKLRRSKSLTRNDKSSRTSSPHHDQSTNKDTPARSGAETSGVATNGGPGPRSSIEKSRALKMFKVNSRPSLDRDADVPNGHKKADSLHSENSRHPTPTNEGPLMLEDEFLQQEFDDLMRSSSTMKVSLTPDRLKSMEVYKQERGNRKRPVPLSFNSEAVSSVHTQRTTGRGSSVLRADSIIEDEEEAGGKASQQSGSRSRQSSTASPPMPSTGLNRIRSLSTSSSKAASRAFAKLAQSTSPPVTMHNRQYIGKGTDSFPPRTRKVQHNRESMDLDDVMGGSDDEDVPPVPAKPTTPLRRGQNNVSATTKELMDFLAQGPPDVGGRTNISNGSPDAMKIKSTGRLQRMISKLSLSNPERLRGIDDSPKMKAVSPPGFQSNITQKSSYGNLSSLANRPVPPRPPPRLISPPASPHDSSDEQSYSAARSGTASGSQGHGQPPAGVRSPEATPLGPSSRDHSGSISSNQPRLPPNAVEQAHHPNGMTDHVPPVSPPPRTSSAMAKIDDTSFATERHKSQDRSQVASPSSLARKPVPTYSEQISDPHLSANDAQDLRRLMTKAATAEECRLILDSFLAKSGIPREPASYDVPYPSPSPSVFARKRLQYEEADLEAVMVELLLGGGQTTDSSPYDRRPRVESKSRVEPDQPLGPQTDETANESEVEHKESSSVDGISESFSDLPNHAKPVPNYTLVGS